MKRTVPHVNTVSGVIHAMLALAVLAGPFAPFAGLLVPQAKAQATPALYPIEQYPTKQAYRSQINVFKGVKIAPETSMVNLNLRNTDIPDLLQLLAQQGGFNIIVDSSVSGTMTVDIKNISVNKALEYIFTTGNLSYSQEGNTIIVASTETTDERALNAKTFKAIPVKYKDAGQIATQLNQTVFSAVKPGTNPRALASFDPDSNSILLVGTQRDIDLVEEVLPQLDVERNRKVFKVMHSRADQVAQNLSTNLFAGWAAQASGGAGGGAAGGAGGGAAGGAGGGAAGGAGGGAAGGAGGGAAGGAGQSYARGGFSMVPNTVAGTITVYGTPEQIAQVDALISEFDIARPQVMIEVALVEVSKSNAKVFQPFTNGSLGFGEFRIGIFNGNPLGILSGLSGQGSAGSGLNLPSQFGFNFNNNDSKAKILANPTILALDGTTSSIKITDTIVYFTSEFTQGSAGVPPVITISANSQEVGIELEITPRITNDGNITLALQPKVSQLLGIKQDPTGTVTAPEISQREFQISSARVQDGQTLVLGGLMNEARSENWDKIPGLSNLPIVGALFRSTTSAGNQSKRTELMVMVTPHILKEDLNPAHFGGTPYAASDKDAVQVLQHGRVGTPVVPHGVTDMGAVGGQLNINTGTFEMPIDPALKAKASNYGLQAPKKSGSGNTNRLPSKPSRF
jgi:type II secretory pathway component GspD/PulD (secretin)